MKTRTSRKSGFTLLEIMIVVSIIGTLAAIAIPNFVKARGTSQQNACINNLRQLDSAAQTWALENRKQATDTYSLDVLKPYVRLDVSGNVPGCPGGGTYSPGATVANPPICSLSTQSAAHVLP